VVRTGAEGGSILVGVGSSNAGLRLRVLEPQSKGEDGPIRGRFQILHAGDGVHAPALGGLKGQVTDAAAVLAAIRRDRRHCVSVVNANILAVENGRTGGATPPTLTRR
jgi:hypothetical protein